MNPNIHNHSRPTRQIHSNLGYLYSNSRNLNASSTNPILTTPYMSRGNFSQLNLALGLTYNDSIDNTQLYQPESMALPDSNNGFVSTQNTSRATGNMLLSDLSGQNLPHSSISQQALLSGFGEPDIGQPANGLTKQRPAIPGNLSAMELGNGILFPGQYSASDSFVTDKSGILRDNSQFPQSSGDLTNNSKNDLNSTLVFQVNASRQNSLLGNSISFDNITPDYDSQVFSSNSSLPSGPSIDYIPSDNYSQISDNALFSSNNASQYNMGSDVPNELSGLPFSQTYGKENVVSSFESSDSSGLQTNTDSIIDRPISGLGQNKTSISTKSDFTPSQFLKTLSEFLNRRNTSITQLPYIGSRVVNPWALYSIVTSLGGMAQVNKQAIWPQVAKSMGFNDTELNAPWILKNSYLTLLYPFEQAYFSYKLTETSILNDTETVLANPSPLRSSSSLQTFIANENSSPSLDKNTASAISTRNNQPDVMTTHATPNQISPSSSPSNMRLTNRSTTKPSGLSICTSAVPGQEFQAEDMIYKPQVRSVESYGGVDLRLFQQPTQKHLWPKLGDSGHIDIHALMMSIKSGLKMETINALNVLSMLTVERSGTLLLEYCDELLEALIDWLTDFYDKLRDLPTFEEAGDTSYSHFYEASHMESCQVQENFGTDKKDLHTFGQVSCCVTNIIRNLTFVTENQNFIANHPQFVNALIKHFGARGHKGMNSFLLENRKNILVIFSNIGSMMRLESLQDTRLLIENLIDLLKNAGDTYSSLAMDTLAKLTVPYENRAPIFEVLFANCEIFDILIKHIPLENLHSLAQEKELVVAEMSILTLQNICSIADAQSRRRIAEIPGLVLSLMRLAIRMSERSQPTFDLFRPLCSKILETLRILSSGNQDIFGYHLDRFVNLFTSKYLDTFVIAELARLSNSQIGNI